MTQTLCLKTLVAAAILTGGAASTTLAAEDEALSTTARLEQALIEVVPEWLVVGVDSSIAYKQDPKGRDGDEETDLFFETDLSLELLLTDQLSVFSFITLESDADKGTLAPLDEPVLGLDSLYLWANFFDGSLFLFGGRIEPEFESDFGAADGVLDESFRNDYEFSGVLAVGFKALFDALDGAHELTGALFMEDRTFLSQTLINSTRRTRLADGGVANTEAPRSVVLKLNGEKDWFDYTVSYRWREDRAERVAGSAIENSFDESAGLLGVGATLLEHKTYGALRLAAEVFAATNYDGFNEDAHYWSVGASYEIADLSIGAFHGARDIEDFDIDHFSAVSAEYEVVDGLFVGGEVQRVEDFDGVRGVIGAQVAYRLSF